MLALCLSIGALLACAGCAQQPVRGAGSAVTAWPPAAAASSAAELRGTWLTTTANDALATPANTQAAMRRLREIGLNTVYVEAWKNGYTQFPSQVLQRTIGVSQRSSAAASDPSDSVQRRSAPARDLLQESLIAAHREGLVHIAWFEYGFMAAHQHTLNHLRRLKPEWLSRNAQGSEVAPNGFVWMNPLHPQARRFLTDLVLEAVDRYDLDGVQLDDRIVWPHVTMGYDDYTRGVYAREHGGAQPPQDPRDPAWMRWRAAHVDAAARAFVAEIKARRPGLVVSLSPAVYPWSWDNYLLNWPAWAAWDERAGPRWDEIIPQAYRFSYEAFERTWLEQTRELKAAAPVAPMRLLAAGVRLVGEGSDSSWPQLRDSMLLVRRQQQGGHVHWFSRGVLDVFARELTQFYAESGAAHNPQFPPRWRPAPVVLHPLRSGMGGHVSERSGQRGWSLDGAAPGAWRVIGFDGTTWHELQTLQIRPTGRVEDALWLSSEWSRVELLRDRRPDMASVPKCRARGDC